MKSFCSSSVPQGKSNQGGGSRKLTINTPTKGFRWMGQDDSWPVTSLCNAATMRKMWITRCIKSNSWIFHRTGVVPSHSGKQGWILYNAHLFIKATDVQYYCAPKEIKLTAENSCSFFIRLLLTVQMSTLCMHSFKCTTLAKYETLMEKQTPYFKKITMQSSFLSWVSWKDCLFVITS